MTFSGWMKNQAPNICCLQVPHLKYKETREKKHGKRHNIANTTYKEAGMAILVWEKADFRTQNITKNIEEHYIMIKTSAY